MVFKETVWIGRTMTSPPLPCLLLFIDKGCGRLRRISIHLRCGTRAWCTFLSPRLASTTTSKSNTNYHTCLLIPKANWSSSPSNTPRVIHTLDKVPWMLSGNCIPALAKMKYNVLYGIMCHWEFFNIKVTGFWTNIFSYESTFWSSYKYLIYHQGEVIFIYIPFTEWPYGLLQLPMFIIEHGIVDKF